MPNHRSVSKYLVRLFVGGLVLLSLEYFVIGNDIHSVLDVSKYNILIWWLGFLVVNLLVARFVILLPAWQEPNSLKVATLALGSCLLAFFLFAILYLLKITNSMFIFLLFPLSDLSLILSVLGLVLGNADDKTGNMINLKTKNAIKMSMITLGPSLFIIFPQFVFLHSAY